MIKLQSHDIKSKETYHKDYGQKNTRAEHDRETVYEPGTPMHSVA